VSICGFEPRFIDRVEEINALKDWCSDFRGIPLYIYGPEGCGKTRLLREFVRKFNDFFGDNAVAVYIDALERSSVSEALYSSPKVKILENVIRILVERFIGQGVGKVLADNISTILEKAIARKKYENSYILIVVDDVVKAIGLNRIEWYVKWLYELMWKLAEKYRPKSINFIVTTSEGISLDLVTRHRHSAVYLIWNLDREGFEELFYELNPPSSISFEDIWKLLGGNPGKLIELAKRFKWNIEMMIREYTNSLERTIVEVMRMGLLEELKMIVEDIDALYSVSSPKMSKLEEMLVERNLIIYKKWSTISGDYVPPNREIGVGLYYAWQVPLYREVIAEIIEK